MSTSKYDYANLPVFIEVNSREQSLHYHYDLEIIWVMRGRAKLFIESTLHDIKEGDMRIININDMHGIQNKSDDFVYIALFFDMPFFNRFIPNIESILFECTPDSALGGKVERYLNILNNYFWSITDAFFQVSTSNDLHTFNDYIIEQSAFFLTELRNWFTTIAFDEELKKDDRIWVVIDYIYDNYMRKLPLSEVADYVFLTPSYLAHYIKKATNHTYQELVNFTRSEIALKMLIETTKSISKISNECGFSEPKYFKKYFTMFYGISPQEYRKAYGFNNVEEHSVSFKTFDINAISSEAMALVLMNIKIYSTQPLSLLHKAPQESIVLNLENSTTPQKKKGLCLHIGKASHLYSPANQSLLKTLIKTLKINSIYIEGYNSLSTTDHNLICEIIKNLGCHLIDSISDNQYHTTLYETDISEYKALITADGYKTPHYYMSLFRSIMSDYILDSDADYLATNSTHSIEILITNVSNRTKEYSLAMLGLKKSTYAKTVLTLNISEYERKLSELNGFDTYYDTTQLHTFSEMFTPAASCDTVSIFSKQYISTISLKPQSCVLLILRGVKSTSNASGSPL